MTVDDFLASFARFGIDLGLERIEQLLQDLGNPERQVPIIHVAGTNGKGSVCAYVSSILQAAGYKVGRYISPHLVDWRERIVINGVWISDEDLLEALQQVNQVILPESMPTQFEVITAAAWWYFAHAKVDIAVIDSGLGGRLDATNVVDTPLVSVITSISRDHWQRLGDTLGAIASEKAGIIKPHRPVMVGELPLEALEVIERRALACDAPIALIKPATKTDTGAIWQGLAYPLPLLGQHQLMNSAIALATIQSLQTQGWQITPEAINQGMKQTQWSGRLQWVWYKPALGQPCRILIDGAHNVAAAQYLRQFVDEYFPDQPKHWVVGMLDTKDHEGILRSLLRPEDSLALVPISAHQTANPDYLVDLAFSILRSDHDQSMELDQLIKSYPNLDAALNAVCSQEPSDLVILCGSLYLVGEFLQHHGNS